MGRIAGFFRFVGRHPWFSGFVAVVVLGACSYYFPSQTDRAVDAVTSHGVDWFGRGVSLVGEKTATAVNQNPALRQAIGTILSWALAFFILYVAWNFVGRPFGKKKKRK